MPLRALLIHLRLPFHLVLAPLFLWGVFLSGNTPTRTTLLGFVIFHAFGYGGGTAFNSCYDRDTGPIGGVRRPPPVPTGLLPFSLGVLLAGLGLAWLVSRQFAALYAAMAALAILYSHPAARLKGKPWPALATVAIGQGFGGFLGGWLATGASLAAITTPTGIGGLLSAATITMGFYPLTQVYQIEEDRRRGDRTPAVAWGPGAAFALAACCLLASAPLLFTALRARATALEGAAVAFGVLCLVVAIVSWQRRFARNSVDENFRWLMRIQAGGSAGFGAYLVARLALEVWGRG